MEQTVNSEVWADEKNCCWGQNAVPVLIRLKDPHLFPHQKQYPLKPEVKEGLKPHHWEFKGAGAINSL